VLERIRRATAPAAIFAAMVPRFFTLLIASTLADEASAAGVDAAANAIEIKRIRPETVFAERLGSRVRLNFDIEFENRTKEDVELGYLELRAFDADGRFLTRAQIGNNGLPGPIEDLPDRIVPADGTLYLFNPFADLPVSGAVRSIRLRVFHSAGSNDFTIETRPPPGPRLDRPPLAETGYVFSGSDAHSHHQRVSLNSAAARALGLEHVTQRFAIDLTVVHPRTGDLAPADALRQEDWHAFGAAVVAPVSGSVVEVRSGMADSSLGATGNVSKPDDYDSYGDTASLGNFLVIQSGDAFLVMSHFRQDSVRKRRGDRVTTGERLGEIGLSGDTAYPHLHMQLQTSADPLSARPLPIEFRCVRIGPATEGPGVLNAGVDTGMFVAPCTAD